MSTTVPRKMGPQPTLMELWVSPCTADSGTRCHTGVPPDPKFYAAHAVQSLRRSVLIPGYTQPVTKHKYFPTCQGLSLTDTIS